MKPKYNATKVVIDGIRFDSKMESKFYTYFKENGIEVLELQPEFILQEKFKHGWKAVRAIEYRADFKIRYKGKEFYIDAKGMVMPIFALKLKMWLKLYGSSHILVVAKSIKQMMATLDGYCQESINSFHK